MVSLSRKTIFAILDLKQRSGVHSHLGVGLPRGKFRSAEAQLFRKRAFAGRNRQHFPEDPLPGFGDGFSAVGDGAAVDVHVLAHSIVHWRV